MPAKPTPKQLDFLDWEFGVFFHFGIRSFYPGHRDWDGVPMPAEGFFPDQLDCDEWCREAKAAGAAYAILTCKHHDGFANWPSRYTSYSVAATPWKDGKGDVVKEFTDACRKNGLRVGLYYSPAQWGDHAVSFANDRDYDDYFIHQIGELLTGYGEIDYLWFDGCGSEGHRYDEERIIGEIRRMQPGIRIFEMWDPDSRWVGNEDGYAPDPNGNETDKTTPLSLKTEEERRTGIRFLPVECDMKMRDTWFFDHNPETVKTTEELLGIWEYSVGRGGNLLLDIGPDDHGRLPEEDVRRLREFASERDRRFGHPLPFSAPERDGDVWHLRFAGTAPSPFPSPIADCVILREDLSGGNAITSFEIAAHLPAYRDATVTVFRGTTVGHCRICSFPPIRTGEIEVRVTGKNGEPNLLSATVHHKNHA